MPIGNEAYNRLYSKMKSVNTLLAWGHARVIENLMGVAYRMNPPPVRAISDQFAHDKGVIAKALMTLGREHRTGAAAQGGRRPGRRRRLHSGAQRICHPPARLGRKYDMEFPKGASAAVDAAAKEFVAKRGAAELSEVAKTHFRTALRAQGLPEPPKEWKRRGTELSANAASTQGLIYLLLVRFEGGAAGLAGCRRLRLFEDAEKVS